MFWTGIDRGGPVLRANAALEGRAAADDLEAGNFRRIAVILPPDQPWDRFPFLHPGAGENPVLRRFANPVAAAIHGIDVARAHEKTFIRAALGERAVEPLAIRRVFIIGTIRAAAEHDAIGRAAGAGAQRSHPADRVPGEEEDIHAGVAHADDALVLSYIPILVVPDT